MKSIMSHVDFHFKGFGFENATDWLNSSFHIDAFKGILMWSVSLGTLASMFEKFVGLQPIVYIAFVMLMGLEFVTGVKASLKSGKKIQSRKFGRLIVKIGTYTTIIGIVNIFKSNIKVIDLHFIEINMYEWIFYIILHMITLQMILSVLENLHKLGMTETNAIMKLIKLKFSNVLEFDKVDEESEK